MLLGFLMGCTGTWFKNMGRFEPSDTATEHFEKFVVHNDYNYFLSGSDVYPLSIFGLKKDYTIDGDEDLWKKIAPKQEVIAELVSNMQKRQRECCFLDSLHGFDILDHQGKKIGEWYSLIGITTGIKIKEGGKVVIYPISESRAVIRYQERY